MKQEYDFKQIFADYKNKIYRLALGITRNEKDAEDVLQSTFVKVLGNIEKFKKRSRISTWMYRIAYNEALMLLRKKRKELNLIDDFDYEKKTIPSGILVNWQSLPDKQLVDAESKERLSRVIKDMPIKYRMPLLLQRIEGASGKKTAEILGLNLNSVKTRLHRAVLIIKSAMTAEDPAAQPEKPEDEQCNIVIEFIYDYAEGRVAAKNKKIFEKHIRDCEKCREFLDAYNKAIMIIKALYCDDLPPELYEKIKAFLLGKSPENYRKSLRLN